MAQAKRSTARRTKAAVRPGRRSLVPVAKAPVERREPVAEAPARMRILEAALTAFAERGFDGVSVTDVARSAGVTQPLIHYHFKSKDDLWHAAVDQAFDELRAVFATALDEVRGIKARDALRLLVRRFVLFSGRKPAVGLIMVREGFEAGPRLDWLLRHHLEPLHELVEPFVAEGIRAGELKPLPLANMSHVLIGAVSAFFGGGPLIQRLYGIDPTSPEEVNRHADVVEEVMLHGVIPATKSR